MESRVYAQIYSLIRQQKEKSLEAIEKLAGIGYDGVELLGSFTGGMSYEEFGKYLKDLGVTAISSHGLNTEEDMEFGQAIGLKFCDMRFGEQSRNRDAILRECERLNEMGALRARYGIKGVLHNHATEFYYVDGEEGKTRIYDLILEHTDPALVGMEFDVGWGQRGGVDPVEYIKKYAGRFDLIHVKACNEVAKNEEEMEHFPKRILGMGKLEQTQFGVPKFTPEMGKAMYESRKFNGELGENGDLIDWKALVAAADRQGCQGYINEREYYHAYGAEGDAYRCAVEDYRFLRSL